MDKSSVLNASEVRKQFLTAVFPLEVTDYKVLGLLFEETYLRAIPRATQYEKSFMHRDTVSHVIATA